MKVQQKVDGWGPFTMADYMEIDVAIQRYCDGEELTWRDHFNLLPQKAFSLLWPWGLEILNQPEVALVRQIDAVYTCEFKSLDDYGN